CGLCQCDLPPRLPPRPCHKRINGSVVGALHLRGIYTKPHQDEDEKCRREENLRANSEIVKPIKHAAPYSIQQMGALENPRRYSLRVSVRIYRCLRKRRSPRAFRSTYAWA